ncbi:hypothetical protein MalM14_31220 [Gimesia chilikensis]|nr:hypothetical protein MalM14_31220 [Gimesia chilikensis]
MKLTSGSLNGINDWFQAGIDNRRIKLIVVMNGSFIIIHKAMFDGPCRPPPYLESITVRFSAGTAVVNHAIYGIEQAACGIVNHQAIITVETIEGQIGQIIECDDRTTIQLIGAGIGTGRGNNQFIIADGSLDGQILGNECGFNFIEDYILIANQVVYDRDRTPVRAIGG